MRRRYLLPSLPFLLLLFLSLRSTNAWGKIGHQVIANLAWRLLDDDEPIQSRISSVLAGSYGKDEGCSECSPLGKVAAWADAVRYTSQYHWTTPLHFVDIRDDLIPGHCPVVNSTLIIKNACHFDYRRDCPDDFCAAGSIVNYTSQLLQESKSTKRNLRETDRQEREALMFLTHFVGDIHQPLHVSRKSDRGGNTIHVAWPPGAENHGYLRGHYKIDNLHAVWDDGLIDLYLQEHGSEQEDSRTLLENDLWKLVDESRNTTKWHDWTDCANGVLQKCTSQWARESWSYAIKWAYRNVDGTDICSGDSLSGDYYKTRIGIVLERLAVAGVRLATTLSDNLQKEYLQTSESFL